MALIFSGALVGFISLGTSADPYSEMAPYSDVSGSKTELQLDTVRPGNFPYPTAFNFNYSALGGMNGGTTSAIQANNNFVFVRWNATSYYRFSNSGPGGGPGALTDSGVYGGTIRDLTYDGTHMFGGAANNVLRRMDPTTMATINQKTITGAIFRAIAWDPNRKGFWNSDFAGNVTCYDTNGVLRGTITTVATAKYGLAFDSSSTADSAFLWVWNQGPGGTAATTAELYKYHVGSGTLKATYIFTLTGPGVGIAGGAEVQTINGNTMLYLNFQNQATTGYTLRAGGGGGNDYSLSRGGFNLAIPDNSPVGVSDSIIVTGGGNVLGVEVVLDSILHTWCGDLKVTLTHGGRTDTLVSRMGTGTFGLSQNDLINVWLKDTATRGIWTAVAADSTPQGGFRGSWRPGYRSAQDSLAKFIGLPAAGSWVIKVTDNAAGDLGTFRRWTLKLKTASSLTNITQTGTTTPDGFKLSQNYPNPFNPTTKINFSLPKSGNTTLKVYDMLGKEVMTLVNDFKVAGSYVVDFNAATLSSGTYFYRLESNGFVDTKKMLLIK
ncbi:MAG TPA: T9SS type A sorting domain-containing protein [Ignavibacteria bacterium]|nr:T9SS type A sorting domain-containing protein [Ignavibacteria bacterium]